MAIRRTPVFTAIQPQVLGSGLMPDLHVMQRTLWETAENVSFQNGRIRRRKPNSLMFNADLDPIRGLGQLRDTSGVRWVWVASGGEVYRWYGPAAANILTGESWQEDTSLLYPPTFWDFVPYGDWMVINSGQGHIRIYKPGTGIVSLTDSPQDIQVVRKKYNFLLAFGYSGNKTRVAWSDADDFDVWTAGPSVLAGSLTVNEFDTPLIAAVSLGDSDAMYAEDQMAVLNYVGAPYYFGYKFRLDGIGACGKASVASDGKNNLGVGRNGVWWTDGLSYRYIDEGYLHDYLQENVNWDEAGKIVACRNDITGCFDFCFPMGVSLVPDEGWSFDPRVGSWHQIPAFSLKDERRLFRSTLVGTLAGDVELEMDDTAGLALTLATKPLLGQLQDETGLRDVHHNVLVDEVDLMLKAATNVQWRLGSCQEPAGTYVYTPWVDAEAGAKSHLVPKQTGGRSLPSGVYHKLEFQSTASSWDLDLQGFQLFGTIEGSKRGTA